jgi:hypothetical protein
LKLEARNPNPGPAVRSLQALAQGRLHVVETVGVQPRLGVLQWFLGREPRQANIFPSLYSFSHGKPNCLDIPSLKQWPGIGGLQIIAH